MKKIYTTIERSKFWENYWKKVSEDPDFLDPNSYPIHLIDKYILKNTNIIDIGCGLGRVVKHYHKNGITVFGLEYDSYSLHKLKSENINLPLVQATVTMIPFQKNAFDITMAFGVIGHLETGVEPALSEINRILKSKGIFALSLCYNNFGRFLFQLLHKIPYILLRKQKYFYTYLFTYDEIIQLLNKNGFEIIEISPINSREIIYNYLPILRKKNIGIKERRGGNYEKSLNIWGELLYNIISKYPYSWTFAVSIVARKRL